MIKPLMNAALGGLIKEDIKAGNVLNSRVKPIIPSK